MFVLLVNFNQICCWFLFL